MLANSFEVSFTNNLLAWAKWAEWKWPVEVTFTNKTAFKAAGAVEAAATL